MLLIAPLATIFCDSFRRALEIIGDVVARAFEACLDMLRAASVPMRYPGLLQVILPLHLA